MSEPIKVGDLVMVVRPASCCGHARRMGFAFVITRIHNGSECATCRIEHPGMAVAIGEGMARGVRVPRLKRIPPLSELEGEKNKEELTA